MMSPYCYTDIKHRAIQAEDKLVRHSDTWVYTLPLLGETTLPNVRREEVTPPGLVPGRTEL